MQHDGFKMHERCHGDRHEISRRQLSEDHGESMASPWRRHGGYGLAMDSVAF